jgi:hypothetical protein
MKRPPNTSMQTDRIKLLRLLRSQEPRQLAPAADLGRYTAGVTAGTLLGSTTGNSTPPGFDNAEA